MKFIRIILWLVFPFYLLSCGTQKKLPYYLENAVDTSGKEEVQIPELHIQKNDLLSIQVYSMSTRPDISDAMYNLPSVSPGNQTGGFLVDHYGNIEYPRLGTIHAEGLTKQELAAEIKKRLTQPVELLSDPTVMIRFLSFKITFLGQVGREGVVNIPGERINILEAIGLAGGITDYGKKNNVKIIREINGKRQIGFIDLSTKDVFNSPFYYLMQNDIVVVEPTKQKINQTDQASVQQKVSFAISIISSIAVIYSIIKN
jgi:polysaccharide export outer membrane protein